MKIPIWFKGRDGNWKVFPAEISRHLQTFQDGKQGVSHVVMREADFFVNEVSTEDFWKIFDRHDPRYILREEPACK
jgi:hypothetical protein